MRDDTPPIPGAVYTLARDGSAPAGYPEHPVEDPFSETCFESDYEARRQAFLEHVRRSPAPEHLSAVFHETARMAAGGEPHVAVIGSALDHIDERRDCADFVMHAILRLAPVPRRSAHPRAALDPYARLGAWVQVLAR